jgi:O-Antigen ligase
MSDILVTSSWESKLAKWAKVFVMTTAAVVVCRVAWEESVSWFGWVVVGAAVLALTVMRWPYGALFVLISAAAMPRMAVGLFGWNARPEHFAAAIVGSCAGVRILYAQRRRYLYKLDYWILAYVLINYLSSAFGSPEPSTTLRWALQNNLAVLPYFLIRLLISNRRTLVKGFDILLSVGLAEVTLGLLCAASHSLFGTSVGVELGYLGNIAAPFGTMYEPNLFGAYSGCIAVLFLAQHLMGGQRRAVYLIGFLLSSLGTLFSFSRAAVLALVISVGWVFWKSRRDGTKSPSRVVILALGLILILVITATTVGGVLQERLGGFYYEGLTESAALSRVLVIQQAMQEVPDHLLLGQGTASFNLSFDWASYIPEWSSEKTWIPNAPLRILHDTGLLGLCIFGGFLVSLWWQVRRSLSESFTTSREVATLVGLSAGVLLYVMSFQLTDGTTLAFCWVHLGFLAAAATLIGTPNTAGTRSEVRRGGASASLSS